MGGSECDSSTPMILWVVMDWDSKVVMDYTTLDYSHPNTTLQLFLADYCISVQDTGQEFFHRY